MTHATPTGIDDPDESEEWRPVEGFPNYLVSSLGRIYSIPRVHSRGGIMNLTLWRDGKGGQNSGFTRLVVMLQGQSGRKNCMVHQLVAAAFLGPCPPGLEVCHGPNGSLDNRVGQIRYDTHQRNVGLDKRRDGTQPVGEEHWKSKLTMAIVSECRLRAAAGETQAALAAEFGVGQGTIGMAVTGRTWAECPVPPLPSPRRGQKHAYLKLTPEVILAARQRCATGEAIVSVAADLGTTASTLGRALSGKTRAYRTDSAA
jgi:hypothetical protein